MIGEKVSIYIRLDSKMWLTVRTGRRFHQGSTLRSVRIEKLSFFFRKRLDN
jgi:hypothetical protein